MKVGIGDPAPEFTLLDQRGEPWSLADQRGRPVVLYFYPKDDTPRCTNQACDVRDHWVDFTESGAAVAGISPGGRGFSVRRSDPATNGAGCAFPPTAPALA